MRYNRQLHELGDWQDAMNISSFPVSPLLSDTIESYSLLLGEDGFASAKPWYILPDNSGCLIFYLFEDKGVLRPSLRLIGPRTEHKIINRAGRKVTFIAYFKPGGLYRVLDHSILDLVDNAHNASDFLKIDNRYLETLHQAAEQLNWSLIKATLESIILDNQRERSQHTSAIVDEFLRRRYKLTPNVSEMAREIGVTERHLRNLVRERVGHSPKLVLQIERFTRSLELRNKDVDWSTIAFQSGYYDQSHMIADFQRMIAISPQKLYE